MEAPWRRRKAEIRGISRDRRPSGGVVAFGTAASGTACGGGRASPAPPPRPLVRLSGVRPTGDFELTPGLRLAREDPG